MTSAPNPLQPLSGSRILLLSLVMSGIVACTTSRPVSHQPSVTPPPQQEEDKVRVYDQKVDSTILVTRDAVKVDTIEWKEDMSAPAVTDEMPRVVTPIKKEHHEIALLIPFDAANATFYGDQQDSKLNRFLQYYAGMQMASHEMDSLGWPVTVRSFDVGESGSLPDLLKQPELGHVDVIVGPYDKEDLEVVASFGLKHEEMVVSPWLPAFSVQEANPFFIQIFPGLSTHANAILEYIRDSMPGKKVYVVARNTPQELNRIQLFTKNSTIKVNELIINDSSPDLEKTDLHALLNELTGTIFILPYFTKTDEGFVNSFMRKLHADKETKEAIVFGLPQWVGYSNLNPNYMESLSLHLSISAFIDVANPSYMAFRHRFFATYHTVPDLQAFQGYDLMLWLARRLMENGQEGLIGHMDPTAYGLASGFDIEPVFKSEISSPSEMKQPLYYENKRIRIIRYLDQDFTLIR